MMFQSIRFIDEPIAPQFEKEPLLSKKPGCPNRFEWRGQVYEIVELVSEWHDYSRRGKMSQNMRLSHSTRASQKGSWGVGVDYYRVRTVTNQFFDLYYDRAPKSVDDRKGGWFLYRELRFIEDKV